MLLNCPNDVPEAEQNEPAVTARTQLWFSTALTSLCRTSPQFVLQPRTGAGRRVMGSVPSCHGLQNPLGKVKSQMPVAPLQAALRALRSASHDSAKCEHSGALPLKPTGSILKQQHALLLVCVRGNNDLRYSASNGLP